MALDTYFRGSPDEVEFCEKVKAGGNHLVAATAGGRPLGTGTHLCLRERELAKVVDEFKALPESERRPALPPVDPAARPKRPVPRPPAGGLVLKGYCSYATRSDQGRVERSTEYYYKENPDRWPAESQSDTLWLTEAEARSLLPDEPKAGDRLEVPPPIQKRFFSTIGIDYMEGSVNSLPPRETRMTLTAESVSADAISMRLDGYGKLGKELDETRRREPRSRGCEVRVLGFVAYDRTKRALRRFDVVGVGLAWGSKMDYVDREVRIERHPWMYGIACELADGARPIDRIPPYNLLHYGEAGKYFGKE